MENENNNYSFTPITEDNSVNEIKDDFFGENTTKSNDTTPNEVPPILDVSELKEESAPVAETLINDVTSPENNVEQNTINTLEPAPMVESNMEEVKTETLPAEQVANEDAIVTPEPVTEISNPSENVSSGPVEVKIPEGLDDEPKEDTPTPVVEPTVSNSKPQPETPKKNRSIFDFFKTKETPTIDNSKSETTPDKPSELDPFNNFVADVPENITTTDDKVSEPIAENNKPNAEVSLPSIEETPVTEENKEISLPSVDEPIPEPISNEENELPTFNNVENNFEPVKEPEPIVKEVVVEKEKVVLGKKCPNCGEVTAETFCPNCGFLVE